MVGKVTVCVFVQATQVEVVLLVFRRLAEELQVQSTTSLTPTRRKEMSAALREQIGAIYQFLMQNLEVHIVVAVHFQDRMRIACANAVLACICMYNVRVQRKKQAECTAMQRGTVISH